MAHSQNNETQGLPSGFKQLKLFHPIIIHILRCGYLQHTLRIISGVCGWGGIDAKICLQRSLHKHFNTDTLWKKKVQVFRNTIRDGGSTAFILFIVFKLLYTAETLEFIPVLQKTAFWSRAQACTRITELVGWLVVLVSPCRKWPNTQEDGCWLPHSDHIHIHIPGQTRPGMRNNWSSQYFA